MIGNKKFNADLKKGVPSEFRGDVWILLIGNSLRINLSLYEKLLERVRIAQVNIERDKPFK